MTDGIRGVLRGFETTEEKVENARYELPGGDTGEAKIIGTDRKAHAITLSIKAKDAKTPAKKSTKANKAASTGSASGKKKKGSDSPLKTTLGDLFKDHIS